MKKYTEQFRSVGSVFRFEISVFRFEIDDMKEQEANETEIWENTDHFTAEFLPTYCPYEFYKMNMSKDGCCWIQGAHWKYRNLYQLEKKKKKSFLLALVQVLEI